MTDDTVICKKWKSAKLKEVVINCHTKDFYYSLNQYAELWIYLTKQMKEVEMTAAIPTSQEEIYAWLVNILHEMFELDKARITLDANLYTDLDIDSIDAVDIAVKLKQLTGKRLQPEVFKSVRTVRDVVDALAGLALE